ncbi:hypothetical protein [Streptomyces sp. SID12501]|uniref:hypothetical protein n=1 Tax=Streptomyces sp. SID12501 TaxID=2706042 RepID=UPI0023B2D6A0|nr:hypothetical protein [Streptomyces sp. SID12501]
MPALQRQLFLLWHRADTTQLNSLAGTAIANALVYMRRTNRTQYDARDHTRSAAQERHLLVARTAEAARRMAFPTGTPVWVLGEAHTGIITHTLIGQDNDSPYPAVWYVVAAPLWRVCRAHGADEIEAASFVNGAPLTVDAGATTLAPGTAAFDFRVEPR